MERPFSHPDVSRFRAEADQNSDHHCHHSGNPGDRPTVVVAHSLADNSLKRRIVGSQKIAELIDHARKRRPDARRRQFDLLSVKPTEGRPLVVAKTFTI